MKEILAEMHNKLHRVIFGIIITLLIFVIALGISFTETYTKLVAAKNEIARLSESCSKNMQFMIDTKQHMNNVLIDASKENPKILPEIQSNNM